MDRVLLLDLVRALENLYRGSTVHDEDKKQFNALLEQARKQYPDRPDILAINPYRLDSYPSLDPFMVNVRRLRVALEIRPPSSATELLATITLPSDAPDLTVELDELQGALALGLHKTALLLAGSIAEALLLVRHPDNSEPGPGLNQLLKAAKKSRPPLFGEDTLRHLETLVDYRNLIHPRSQRRTQIVPNQARAHEAVAALRLLCSELQNTDRRYAVPGVDDSPPVAGGN